MSTMTATLDRVPPARAKYTPPADDRSLTLGEALAMRPLRRAAVGQATDMFSGAPQKLAGKQLYRDDELLFYAGDLSLLSKPCVSVVGTRQISDNGRHRARKLAMFLASHGVVVVSGLAMGVDTIAHHGALEAGGRTMAVLGTPLNKCSPMENAELQECIYRDHLLISQFASGSQVFPTNFPKRNKLMASLSDATVIIEASDTSGTLHQAAECQRLGRDLFILKSVVDTPTLKWPAKFLKHPNVHVLEQPSDVLKTLGLS